MTAGSRPVTMGPDGIYRPVADTVTAGSRPMTVGSDGIYRGWANANTALSAHSTARPMFTPPHCDPRVLHAPGECTYCDAQPLAQDLRRWWGIAFTGHGPEVDELPCPSNTLRDQETIDRWPGNRPGGG